MLIDIFLLGRLLNPPATCTTCLGAKSVPAITLAERKIHSLEQFRTEPFPHPVRTRLIRAAVEDLEATETMGDGTVACPDCWKVEDQGRRAVVFFFVASGILLVLMSVTLAFILS